MRLPLLLFVLCNALCRAPACAAQWQIQSSGTTADLRGVASVGNGTAWASGKDGTVLRTEDSGFVWQGCTVPSDAKHLDFRAIQAFSARSAVVMSSGTGDLSRVYATDDGCVTWQLLFTNPDKEGFFDSLHAADRKEMTILGDPVNGAFRLWWTTDGGKTWKPENSKPARKGEGAYAASNQALSVQWTDGMAVFGTGSPLGARIFLQCDPCTRQIESWVPHPLPMFPRGSTAGVFAIGQSDWRHLVAVGGDYKLPEAGEWTAAWSADAGHHWNAASAMPHGYRSTVAYDATSHTWIAAGPNGTDISTDEGKTWVPLRPAAGDPAGADREWNAIALPFIVGPGGRIGRLREGVLAAATGSR